MTSVFCKAVIMVILLPLDSVRSPPFVISEELDFSVDYDYNSFITAISPNTTAILKEPDLSNISLMVNLRQLEKEEIL